jgi:hypothetical protein
MTYVDLTDADFAGTQAYGQFVVLSAHEQIELMGRPIDGILGTPFLRQTQVLFDFPRHTVTIWQAGEFPADGAAKAGFSEQDLSPMNDSDLGLFQITAQAANGLYHGQDNLRLDTGGFDTILSTGLATQLGLKAGRQRMQEKSLMGSAILASSPVGSLSIGGAVLSDQSLWFPAGANQTYPPTLGMDILSRHRLLLDYPDKKIYLK